MSMDKELKKEIVGIIAIYKITNDKTAEQIADLVLEKAQEEIKELKGEYEENLKKIEEELKEGIKNLSCGDDYYDNCNFNDFEKLIEEIFKNNNQADKVEEMSCKMPDQRNLVISPASRDVSNSGEESDEKANTYDASQSTSNKRDMGNPEESPELKPLVGSIGLNGDFRFRQECGCNYFPCPCYRQGSDGRWAKTDEFTPKKEKGCDKK